MTACHCGTTIGHRQHHCDACLRALDAAQRAVWQDPDWETVSELVMPRLTYALATLAGLGLLALVGRHGLGWY